MFNRSIRTATRAILAAGGLSLVLSAGAATSLTTPASAAAPAAASAATPNVGSDVNAPAAHGHRHHGGHGQAFGPRGLERALAAVHPTEAQRTSLRQVREALRRDLAAQRVAGRALHEQALALYAQPTLDPAAIDALRQRMDAQHSQMSQRVMQANLAMAQVLTPEQRAQLAQRLKEQMDRAQKHWDRRAAMAEPGADAALAAAH